MVATYVHNSPRDIDEALLKARGLKPEEIRTTQPVAHNLKCPACGIENTNDALRCFSCGHIFDRVQAHAHELSEVMANMHMESLKDKLDDIIKRQVNKKLESIFSKMDKSAIKKLLP